MITVLDLKEIMPKVGSRADLYIKPLNDTFAEFKINTMIAVSAFLANVAVESGELYWTKEIWGPTPQQVTYEGRRDLGNYGFGDGHKFLGRGLIQLTGRKNYTMCGNALGLDLVANPELLESPLNATRSAGWFWSTNDLTRIANTGDFKAVVKRINGGLTHYDKRREYYDRAMTILDGYK